MQINMSVINTYLRAKSQINIPMKPLLIAFIFTCAIQAQSQKFSFNFDHYSFMVKDLQTVGDFYAETLGLEEINHPSAKSGFRWFIINNKAQLHLIGKDSVANQHSKSVHLCLEVSDFDGFIRYLQEKKIKFWDWPGKENTFTLRADKARQLYIKDPENNWIEIIERND